MSTVTWWAVQAGQTGQALVLEELQGRYDGVNVSPASPTGWVTALVSGDALVEGLMVDRPQFEVADHEGGFRLVVRPVGRQPLSWTGGSARSSDGTSAGDLAEQSARCCRDSSVVHELVRWFDADPEAVESVLTRQPATAEATRVRLIGTLGLPAVRRLGPVVVCYDGLPEDARRIGQVTGPSTFVVGDAGWSYLKYPASGTSGAVQACCTLARLKGAASRPFLLARQDDGWVLAFPEADDLVILELGRTWRLGGSGRGGPQARATAAALLRGSLRTEAEVRARIEEIDAGRIGVQEFLAGVGLPSMPGRLLDPFGDDLDRRVLHLPACTVEELNAAVAEQKARPIVRVRSVVSGFSLGLGFGVTTGSLLLPFLLLAAGAPPSLCAIFAVLGVIAGVSSLPLARAALRGPRPPR